MRKLGILGVQNPKCRFLEDDILDDSVGFASNWYKKAIKFQMVKTQIRYFTAPKTQIRKGLPRVF